MPKFKYTALSNTGTEISGVISGSSESVAYNTLRNRDLFPITLTNQVAKNKLIALEYEPRNPEDEETSAKNQFFWLGFGTGVLISLVLSILILLLSQ